MSFTSNVIANITATIIVGIIYKMYRTYKKYQYIIYS